jgi:hypothetical protein
VYYYAVCVPALLFPSNLQKAVKTQALDPKLHELAIAKCAENPRHPFFIVKNEDVQDFSSILEAENADDYMLVFANPSTYRGNPGWPLRNLITSVALHR